MADILKAACVQMTSGSDIEANLNKAGELIRQAVSNGARFVATPENTCYMRALDDPFNAPQDSDACIAFFSNLASKLDVTLLIGSMLVKIAGGKSYNRSLLFANDGNLSAIYDKIHLFDVQLPTGESHCESDYTKSGERAVTAKIDDGFTLGMSICYDLRFAHLYRDIAKLGANILSVPAAFTVPTGRAHWEVLLRARAIETGSYVIAPAQTGNHEGGRKTYGHSMIIDPWGRVLAQKESGQGVIMADLDIAQVRKARGAIPALKHDREYEI